MTLKALLIEEAFHGLLDEGAGTWPPTFSNDFPAPLDSLHTFTADEVPRVVGRLDVTSLTPQDVEVNRRWIAARLPDTEEALSAMRTLDQKQLLGMSACVASLSHMFRWGTVPTLSAAQEDTVSHLPNMLLVAMLYLNTRLGIRSTGGTVTTMMYCNYLRDEDRLCYSIAANFDAPMQRAELWTTKLFVEVEYRAMAIYRAICQFCLEVEQGEDSEQLDLVANDELKRTFAYFHKNLIEQNVAKSVWSRYVQGYHGWSWDGFEGVSGNQAFLIRILDALLGIPAVIEPSHLSLAQRNFCDRLRAFDVRARLDGESKPKASKSIANMISILKIWRMGHSKKAIYYEDIHLDERKPMTGGYGVDADSGLEVMIERMRARLQARTKLTR